MRRLLDCPEIKQRDFSHVQAFFSTAAPCPPWLKRAWIDLIGPERLYEAYGATEATGACIIRGDEWLAHPGSVGKPRGCDLKILDEQLQEVPPGVVGEIFMRPWTTEPTYYYKGSPPCKATPDGFMSVGDLGWVDEAGYLFLADRRVDMIVTGGANVYPAEVEAALSEHPAVSDVAVIGVPDPVWGRRVHAVVQPSDPAQPPTVAELNRHCRERLVSYKVPKSYEVTPNLPRDPSGKIRRSAMVAEREAGWSPEMVAVGREEARR
jgi:bile acid-coenzyme A ligase